MEWLQRRWGRLCSAGGGPARSRTPVADGRMARRGRLGAAAGMGPPDGRGGIPGPCAEGRRGPRCGAATQENDTQKPAGGQWVPAVKPLGACMSPSVDPAAATAAGEHPAAIYRLAFRALLLPRRSGHRLQNCNSIDKGVLPSQATDRAYAPTIRRS